MSGVPDRQAERSSDSQPDRDDSSGQSSTQLALSTFHSHPSPWQPSQPVYHHPQPSQSIHQIPWQFNTVLLPQLGPYYPVSVNPQAGGSQISPQLTYPLNTTDTIIPNSTIQTYSNPGVYGISTPLMSRQQPVSVVQSHMSLAGPSTIEGSQPLIDPTQHTTLLPPSSHNVVTPAATRIPPYCPTGPAYLSRVLGSMMTQHLSQQNSLLNQAPISMYNATSQQSQANNSRVNLSGQASHPSSPKRIRLNSPIDATSSHQQSSHNSQTQLELFSHTPQQSTVHTGGTLVHPQQHELVPITHEHSQLPEYNYANSHLEIENASQDSQTRSSNNNEALLKTETQSQQLTSSTLSTAAVNPVTEQQSETSEPSDMNNVLSGRISDLQNVYEVVYKVQSKWFDFGLALGISYSDLESVMKKNQNSPHPVQDSLRDTLNKRLEMKPLTWMDVTKAIRSPTVGHNELAAEIEEQCYQYPPSTSAATAPSNTPLKNYANYLKGKYLKMTVLPDDWPPPLDRQDHFTNLALIERKKYTQLPGARKMESIECDYAYGNVDNIVEKKKPIGLKQIFDPLPGESASQNQFTILMDGAPGVGKTTISRKICIDWTQGILFSKHQLVPILVPLRQLVIRGTSNKEFTIEDLIPTDDLVLKREVVEYVRRTAGDGVMFIFDGFDELSSDQRTRHSLFLDIMRGEKLHNCSVLVTSRTYASGPLETIAQINRHVEVLGFRKKQIKECIMKNIADEDRAKELLWMLNDRMDILSLCYIPLNCRIVLYVYKQQYSLPDTLTKLYEVFILYTLKHYADKISTSFHLDAEEIRCAGDFESLPEILIKQLDCLSELAYNGMTKDKLVFRYIELKNTKDVLSLGLINMIEAIINTGELKYYQFMHLTVQEFLAARYLASKVSDDQKKLEFLTSNLYNDRFRMTLLFLSGLTQLNFIPFDKAFPGDGVFDFNEVRGRKINKSNFLFLAQLLYESRKSTCTWLLPCLVSTRSLNMSGYSLSQFDCIVLAHFLSSTPENHIWDKIDLSNCSLIPDRSEILLSKYHSKAQVPILSMTKELNIDGNKSIPLILFFPIILESHWLQVIEVPELQEKNIRECEKVQAFLTSMSNLKQFSSWLNVFILNQTEFSMKCNCSKMPVYICPRSIMNLLRSLLRELDLSDHPEVVQDCTNCGVVGDQAWKCLCDAFSQASGIEKIALPEMSEEAMSSMLTTLSTMNTVKIIRIQVNNKILFPGQVLNYVLKYLQGPERSIEFHANRECMTFSITKDKMLYIQSTFTDNKNNMLELQSLLLLTDTLFAQFNGTVFKINNLTDRQIDFCGTSNHLRTLIFCDCNNLPVGKLQSMLKATTSLQVLEISGGVVTDGEEFFKSIAMGLTENNSVKELIISNIHISDAVSNSSLATQYSPSSNHTEQVRVLNRLKLQLGTTGLELSIRYLMRKFSYKIVDIEQTSGWCNKETSLFLINSLQPSVLEVLSLKSLGLSKCSLALATVLKQSQVEILGVIKCDVTNELITGIAAAFTSLRELDISGNQCINCKALATFLQQNQITALNISHCNMNDEVIVGIACNVTSLRELDISNNRNITSKALAALLQQSQLTVLKACHCDLNDEIIAGIACNVTSLRELDISHNRYITNKALTTLLQQSQLTVLKAYDCDLNDEVTAGIACNVTSLRELDISFNRNITNKALATLLQQSQLTVLKACHCNLNDEVIAGIACNVTSLRELDIGYNRNITSKALATLLQQSQLTVLKASDCDLNDEVITGIACNVTSLRELDIHGNRNITSKALAALLQQSQLTVLNVGTCNLNDEVITRIACNVTSLRELDIHSNTNITSEGCTKLFNQNISLKKLKIYHINHFNENNAMTRAMCDMIKDNKVMTELIIGRPLHNNIELLAEALMQNNTLEVFNILFSEDKMKRIKDLVTKLGHGKIPKWMHSANN